MDWFSRYVIAWALSDNLENEFVLSNLNKALETNKPEIHNSDQGSHFTSKQYTGILKTSGVEISMDGPAGAWITSLPNGSGAQSSTRTFTSNHTKVLGKRSRVLKNTLISTTIIVFIPA